MLRFRVPFEHRPPTIEELLARAWPESTTEEREEAIASGAVKIGEVPVTKPDKEPTADRVVTADIEVGAGERGIPESDALARGEDWIVVEKPVGMSGRPSPDDPMHPIRFMADRLGLDREGFQPVWSRSARAGGPWLFGTNPEAADRIRRRWREGPLMTTWLALVPRPNIPQGVLRSEEGLHLQYSATTMRNGLCELQLTPTWEGDEPAEDFNLVDAMLEAMAEAGWPVLGDRWRGGYMIAGALRLRLGAVFDAESELQYSWPAHDGWWPADPVLPPEEEEGEEEIEEMPTSIAELDLPELLVDASAIEALRKSQRPWVPTGVLARRRGAIEPGTLVRLRGTNDVYGDVALVDSLPDVAARRWSGDPLDAVYFDQTVSLRLDEAIARRADLIKGVADTDLFRLVHGEADGLPGLYIDRVGPLLRCVLDGAPPFAFKEQVYDLLGEFDDDTLILEVEQTAAFEEGKVPDARIARAGSRYVGSTEPIIIRERGIRYVCNPWSPQLTVDPAHRTTRRQLAGAVEVGSRWLVAASPWTALPVVAAVRGAGEVLFAGDPAATDTLEESIVINGHDTDTTQRVAYSKLGEQMRAEEATFDGVICNLEFLEQASPNQMAARCLDLLADGGTAILYSHPLYLAGDIAELDALDGRDVEPFGPPADYPTLEDFPEGTPYVGVIVRA